MNSKITFVSDDGNTSTEFYILDQTMLAGKSYILATDIDPEGDDEDTADTEDEGCALILRDTAEAGAEESIYEVVEDDAELSAVLALFKDTLEDLGFDLEV